MRLSKKRALVLATLVAPLGLTQPAAAEEYCREFQSEISIDGKKQPSYGIACRQEDGSWKIQQASDDKDTVALVPIKTKTPKKMADATRIKTVKMMPNGGRVVKLVSIDAHGNKVVKYKRFRPEPRREARQSYRKHQPKHMKHRARNNRFHDGFQVAWRW